MFSCSLTWSPGWCSRECVGGPPDFNSPSGRPPQSMLSIFWCAIVWFQIIGDPSGIRNIVDNMICLLSFHLAGDQHECQDSCQRTGDYFDYYMRILLSREGIQPFVVKGHLMRRDKIMSCSAGASECKQGIIICYEWMIILLLSLGPAHICCNLL